jgi:ATP-binding cassette subfamily B protein
MDCGPAALKCLLDGFDVPVSYGRLREACQTGLDGSSIDTIELVANQLGVPAEQVLLPIDHLLRPEAGCLPAVVVVQLPTAVTHFVVVWRRHGNLLQIMDPNAGRRWVSSPEFLRTVYRHCMAVPAQGWREFAGSTEFQGTLEARLCNTGVTRVEAEQFYAAAAADSEWWSLATLDAATRLVQSLVKAKAVRGSRSVTHLLKEFISNPDLIADEYWCVRPAPTDEDGAPQLLFTGAVLVRALPARNVGDGPSVPAEPLSSELSAAIAEKRIEPGRTLWQELFRYGAASVWALLFAAFISSAAVLVEALLFRQLFDVATELRLTGQRMGAVTMTLIFLAILFLFDVALFAGCARLGRQMENGLRIRFLRKLPLLGDAYFQSRLISDMAERSHAMHRIRNLPDQTRQFLVAALKLLATAAGLIWLEPAEWWLIVLIAATALILPLLTKSLFSECDLRVRSHAAGLTRFYLDAMLGLLPIRAHNARRSVAAEQEKLLGCWAEAALRMQKLVTAIEATQLAAMYGLVAFLLLHRSQEDNAGRVLLVVYWTMSLPALGETIASVSRRYAYYRNLTLRLLEPLGAPEEPVSEPARVDNLSSSPAISFRQVSVQAAGHTILRDIDLEIAPAAHVVIVGPSGSGKSTLVGLLLGWHKPVGGELLIDGRPLNATELRTRTAWIDPAVQLWNRSLLTNICYGTANPERSVGTVVDAAMLRTVLENLPEGFETKLGEGGALISGGEGQRVRLARAMLRDDVRLVILDEPFRGLDRDKRHELMRRARRLWRDCTLVCITHDIAEAEQFDEVIVLENGTIAEHGSPQDLRRSASSRYAELLGAEAHAQSTLWSANIWRRLHVQHGRVSESLNSKTSINSKTNAETAEVA